MSKSFYFDTNENKWKSVRGHDCEGAVWVDDATKDEIREYLTKIPELADARAEIESLKLSAGEINGAFSARPKCEKCKEKDKLIEQMREALKAIDGIGREAGNARREDALRCFAIAAAALAAERGE